VKRFCYEASVVGLRYVANASASPFRRSIWVMLLLVGAAFTTFQIQDRIVYYWSYPVSVNIRVEHNEEMRFPTVTICNENRVMRSAADDLGSSRSFEYLTIFSLCFSTSGRFVKQEQWERWRAKRKLVSGSKHRGASARVRGINPPPPSP